MRRFALLLLLPLFGASRSGSPGEGTALAGAHDVHVTNARMAVEGAVGLVQIRIYKDDLALALSGFAGHPVALAASPEVDALAERYLNRRLIVNADGRVLVGRIVSSSEDVEMWSYGLEYTARTPIRRLILTHTVLFDLYEDQRNLLRVMFFPSARSESFYFVKGAQEYRVEDV